MSDNEQILISFKDVSKSYGATVALKDANFEIKKGEFVFITGPSGAGKTTILKLILGEIIPTGGEVKVDNLNVVNLNDKNTPSFRQKIGVIFQDFKVLPDRTVFENVAVALSVIGLPESEWEERAKHVLKLVGLERKINFFPSQLSGGELQRVSLARALSVNPKIILADEPTGNLDSKSGYEVMNIFKDLHEQGRTIVLVTHDPNVAAQAQRTIKLKDGKVIN